MGLPNLSELLNPQTKKKKPNTIGMGLPSLKDLTADIGVDEVSSYIADPAAELPSGIQAIANFGTSVSTKAYGIGQWINNMVGAGDTDEIKRVRADFEQAGKDQPLVAEKILQAFARPYYAEDVIRTGKDINKSMSKPIEASALPSEAGSLAAMPFTFAWDVFSNLGTATTGANIDPVTGVSSKASVDEQASAVKATMGNAAMLVMGPALSEAISASFATRQALRTGVSNIETASMKGLKKLMDDRSIGPIGREIISDVSSAAGAGMTQGMISRAGEDDMLTSGLTGAFLAPIGLVTGFIRGMKSQGMSAMERNSLIADEVFYARQLRNLDATESQFVDRAHAIASSATFKEAYEKVKTIENATESTQDLSKLVKPGSEGIAIESKGSFIDVVSRGSDGLPNGLLKLQKTGDNSAKVVSVFVNPDVRRTGIATTLYDAAEASGLVLKSGETGFSPMGEAFIKARKNTSALPISELQTQANQVVAESLYQKFKSNFNENGDFNQQIVKFGMDNNLAPEMMADVRRDIGHRLFRDFADPADMAKLAVLKQTILGSTSKMTVLDIARERGLYIDHDFGMIVAKDLDGNEMFRAHTTDEISRLMKESGHGNNGALNIDGNGPMPPDLMGTPNAPLSSPNPSDNWTPDRNSSGKLGTGAMAELDIAMGILTPHDNMYQAYDTRTRFIRDPRTGKVTENSLATNFKHMVYEPLVQAFRTTNNVLRERMATPAMVMFNSIAKSMKPERLEIIGGHQETMNIAEVMAPDGLVKGHTVNPIANELAQFLHQNNIDHSKVWNYRSSMRELKMQAITQAHQVAYEGWKMATELETDKMTTGTFDSELASATRLAKEQNWQTPEFLETVQNMRTSFGVDANFDVAVAMLDKVAETGTNNMVAAARLTSAYKNPLMNLTREEYAKHYKMDARELELSNMAQAIYKDYAIKAGIPDHRAFNRYLQHYRQYGDILSQFKLNEFTRSIGDGAMRKFASEMVRTGEISNYETNIALAVGGYVRSLTKAKYLYPEIDRIVDSKDSNLVRELRKVSDPDLVVHARARTQDFVNGLTGKLGLGKRLEVSGRAWLSHLTGMSDKQIVAELKKPGMTDTIMSLNAAGLMGGRAIMAVRDRIDLHQNYYTMFDGERLRRLIRTKVPAGKLEELRKQGHISNPERIDFYNTSHGNQGLGSKFQQGVSELADFGYYLTLQHQFFDKHQGAVFLEQSSWIGPIAQNIIDGKVSKKVGYNKIKLFLFDHNTQKAFNSYIDGGKALAGTELLAKQAVRDMVGDMTKANQPPITNTTIGKMFGQLGGWSMQKRSTLFTQMTRGSAPEVAKRMVRYGVSQSALIVAGTATGLNLGAWMLTPMSLMFTGGPGVRTVQDVVSLTKGIMSEKGGQYAGQQIQRDAYGYVPFGYWIRDLQSAADLRSSGAGYGWFRPIMQAAGVPVDPKRRSFIDYISGTTPAPPYHNQSMIKNVMGEPQ